MPASIISYPSIEYTNFKAYGELSLTDIYAALKSFYKNSSTPTMNALWDLRTTNGKNYLTEDIAPIPEYWKQHTKVRQDGKTAIVASNYLDKIISNALERYEKNLSVAVKIFLSREKAVR